MLVLAAALDKIVKVAGRGVGTTPLQLSRQQLCAR
jgi:hypothetical protein